MDMNGLKTVVCGAGIGGLTLACAMARLGADVTVLEQADEIAEVGAGLQLSPNGMVVLNALGIGSDIAAKSLRADAVSLRNHHGAEVAQLDLARLNDQSYYFTHRADLIETLAAHARGAGVKIRLLQKVNRIETTADGALVHMANNATIAAPLVIGADGLHSRMRPALNGDVAARFTGQVAWRAIVPNVLGQGAQARVYMGPGRHLVCYPLRDATQLNIVAVQERRDWAEEGWTHPDDPANLRAAFADFGADVQTILTSVTDVRLWGLFRHPVAKRWHDDHCALLGDAAHPTLPFMAQGACMAIEDAYVLADSLSRAKTQTEGLALYQLRRQSRVRRVVEAANGNAWKYHIRPAPLRFVAHTVLRTTSRLFPQNMVRQFNWIYGHDVTRAPLRP